MAVNGDPMTRPANATPTPRISTTRDARRATRARRTLATLLLACAATLLGAASAQIDLTTFSAGDVIRADEVNANFRAVADAAEANQNRLDAIATGARTLRVGPHDLVASESQITSSTANGTPYEFTRGPRGKSGLELLGTSQSSGGLFCFGTGLDLPEGASITEFAAILKDPDASGDAEAAEAYLQTRAWTDTRTDTIAAVGALGTTYDETATVGGVGGALPATVDAAAYEYRVVTCLEGGGGFLGARVEYTLP
jgi:hypothetical protein